MHLDRLTDDARMLFGAAPAQEILRELISQATSGKRLPVVMRVTLFNPDIDITRPGSMGMPSVLITTRAVPTHPLRPLHVLTRRYQRPLPLAKAVGIFEQVRLRREAMAAGADDVLMTGPYGAVAEGTTWNVAAIRDGTVCWPAGRVLPGVAMRMIAAHLASHGFHCSTQTLQVFDLPTFDAMIATNAVTGVRPIVRVDEHVFGEETALWADLQRVWEEISPEPLEEGHRAEPAWNGLRSSRRRGPGA